MATKKPTEPVTENGAEPAAAEIAPDAPAEYAVLSPVKHNGVLYRIGEVIELIEEDAKKLIAAGVIEIKKLIGKP